MFSVCSVFLGVFRRILQKEQIENKKQKSPCKTRTLTGAAGENRTHDPVLTKDVRYHYATAALDLYEISTSYKHTHRFPSCGSTL